MTDIRVLHTTWSGYRAFQRATKRYTGKLTIILRPNDQLETNTFIKYYFKTLVSSSIYEAHTQHPLQQGRSGGQLDRTHDVHAPIPFMPAVTETPTCGTTRSTVICSGRLVRASSMDNTASRVKASWAWTKATLRVGGVAFRASISEGLRATGVSGYPIVFSWGISSTLQAFFGACLVTHRL